MEKLFLKLKNAPNSKSVIDILVNYNIIDKDLNEIGEWHFLGGDIHRTITIQSQNSDPIGSLAEIGVNCYDALVNMDTFHSDDKTLIKSIKSPLDAIHKVSSHRTHEGKKSRNNEDVDIFISADDDNTGKQVYPSICFIDRGESQSNNDFESTYLDINQGAKKGKKGNQGTHQMGSTAVLRHCEKGMKLILARKDPSMLKGSEKDLYTFTLIMEFPGTEETDGYSSYKYFKINGELPHFKANSLPIIPLAPRELENLEKDSEKYSEKLSNKFVHGTFIKMYNYKLPTGANTVISELRYPLNVALPYSPFPIKLVDERKRFSNNAPVGWFQGLEEQLKGNCEIIPGTDDEFICYDSDENGVDIRVHVLKELSRPFSKDSNKKRKLLPTIIHKSNYQSQATDDGINYWMTKNGLAYLIDHLFIIVDYSKLPKSEQFKVFQANRENIVKSSDTYISVMEFITNEILTNPALKEIVEKRKLDMNLNIPTKTKVLDIFNKDSALCNIPELQNIIGAISTAYSNVGKSSKGKTKGSQSSYNKQPLPTFDQLMAMHGTPSNAKLITRSNKSFTLSFTEKSGYNKLGNQTISLTDINDSSNIFSPTIMAFKIKGGGYKLSITVPEELKHNGTYHILISMTNTQPGVKKKNGDLYIKYESPKTGRPKNQKSGKNVKISLDNVLSACFEDFSKLSDLPDVDENSFVYGIKSDKLEVYLNENHPAFKKAIKEIVNNGKEKEKTEKLIDIYKNSLIRFAVTESLNAWSDYEYENEDSNKLKLDLSLNQRINFVTKISSPIYIFEQKNNILGKK